VIVVADVLRSATVMNPVILEDPRSGRRLEAWVRRVGEDVVVAIGGGTAPHVGCVVLAQPCRSRSRPGAVSASCSVLTIPPHKEEPIARAVAAALAAGLDRVAVVTAGVHDDNLDAAGVAEYLRLGEELASRLVAELGLG
jgi:hypothetical protein